MRHQMELEEVYIKQATKQGFIKCIVGWGQWIYPTPIVKPDVVEFRRVG